VAVLAALVVETSAEAVPEGAGEMKD